MTSLLFDTGAFIALADKGDELHSRAVDFFETLPTQTRRFTTQAIVAETYTFLRYNQGGSAALCWLDFLDRAQGTGHLVLLYADQDDDGQARNLIRRFADQTLSYTDALSLVAVQKCGLQGIFGFDHHLALAGVPVLPGPLR